MLLQVGHDREIKLALNCMGRLVELVTSMNSSDRSSSTDSSFKKVTYSETFNIESLFLSAT